MSRCWQAEFKAEYLIEITRKTGRPMSYLEFLQTLTNSLESRDPLSYVDLLDFNDLQVLKGQKGQRRVDQDPSKPQKQYLIMTQLDKDTKQKVHYPMPLVPIETEPHLLDPQTMKMMIKKMGQSLKQFNVAKNTLNSTMHSQSSAGLNGSQLGFVTARSFFSKDNPNHPQV